jgi:arylsulfatase A-like enzyme
MILAQVVPLSTTIVHGDPRMLLRRTFLSVLGLFMLCLAGCRSDGGASTTTRPAAESAAAAARPNFLFIITDDQRWDAVGCVQREMGDAGRFPWFTTPNMDRLAREGVRFRNAFVVNSLCAPSRSNFITGRYSHLNGVTNNHTPMPVDADNSAKVLKRAGYATAYIGKFHHDSQKERPGFDYVASYIGQGKYENCPFNVNGTMVTRSGWTDDVATDLTIEYLRDHVKNHPDQPFNVVLGIKAPHDPRTPPARAKERFKGETFRPVPNLAAQPPYPPGKARNEGTKATTDAQLDYFRCISAADDCLGRVLDALDELKLADNTVVVFTSDNGFYLGEHHLADKRSAYDESMRIPLLVRYPRGAAKGKVIDEMVLNIDVPSTFVDLAGVPAPESMQGRSWRPLLARGNAAKWRGAFLYEYFLERGYDAPTLTAVRTPRAKLIKYAGHPEWTELFDLAKDPYETRNLARDPAARDLLARMEQEHDRQAALVHYQVPAYADTPTGPPTGE